MSDYHHGDLRSAIMTRAVQVIEASGPHSLSLRGLAADLGVSHTAPRHHFGDKRGILTAIATEGFRLLSEALTVCQATGGSFLDAGVSYVVFATSHPAHFTVMFAPTLHDPLDPALAEARAHAFAQLSDGAATALPSSGSAQDASTAVVASWGIVHGIATLALTGNLDAAKQPDLFGDDDLPALTRRAAGMLFPSSTTSSPPDPAT